MAGLDPDHFRLKGDDHHQAGLLRGHTSRRQHTRGRFLKGPIPWCWLLAAMRLPGQAIHVGLHLRLQVGIENSDQVSLSLSKVSRECEFSRSSASRALLALEQGGLVSVIRRPGRRPLVTVIELDAVDAGDRGGG